jgi:HAMP domain-containing protein
MMLTRTFADWRIGRKVALMPIVAGVALALILIAMPFAVARNTEIMERIQNGDFPASEATRDMVETLATIQRALQDAASAQDADLLADADKSRDAFVRTLQQCRENLSMDPRELAALERDFTSYYDLARATTLRHINREAGEGVAAALATMQREYNAVRTAAEAMRTRGKDGMNARFVDARRQQGRATRILSLMAAVSVIGILALIVLSFALVRVITGPVAEAVTASERITQGDVEATFAVTSRDEIGQLLRSLQRMVEYLREMAQVAESIAAGDLAVDPRPRGEKDRLGHSFRNMVEKLRSVVGNLRVGADTLTTASREVSAASQVLSRGTSEQAASVEETGASLEEMTASITQNASNSREMEQMARRTDLHHRGDRLSDQSAGTQRSHRGGARRRPRAWLCRCRGRGAAPRRAQPGSGQGDRWRRNVERQAGRTFRPAVGRDGPVDPQDHRTRPGSGDGLERAVLRRQSDQRGCAQRRPSRAAQRHRC